VLERYDFAICAYMATVIAMRFFPARDEVTSRLSTFAAFGVGFVVRSLGGIVIGRLGDDIDARVLDGGDGLLNDAALRTATARVQPRAGRLVAA
jgi:hypothetical protein